MPSTESLPSSSLKIAATSLRWSCGTSCSSSARLPSSSLSIGANEPYILSMKARVPALPMPMKA